MYLLMRMLIVYLSPLGSKQIEGGSSDVVHSPCVPTTIRLFHGLVATHSRQTATSLRSYLEEKRGYYRRASSLQKRVSGSNSTYPFP